MAAQSWGQDKQRGLISLSNPTYDGNISVERAIKERRSTYSFQPKLLTLVQLSKLLWSAQGITDEKEGFRTAPSAGALYPLDVYAVVGDGGVAGLESGVYH